MTARTLALALATGALVVPTAQAMPVEPVNAPGLLVGIVVAAALAAVATAARLQRRHRTATT